MNNKRTNKLANTLTHLSYIAIASLVLLISASATASTVTLQMDINSLTLQAYDQADCNGNAVAFSGINHTGSLGLGTDTIGNDPTQLVSVMIDGVQQLLTPILTENGVSGYINLLNGQILGGHISINVNGDNAINTYEFDIVPQSGSIIDFSMFNYGYVAAGNTINGDFSDTTFGDIDVAPWANNEPLLGSLYQFSYDPDASGFDQNVDLDLSVVAIVPLPTSCLMGACSLIVIGLTRITRRQFSESSI